LLATASCDAKRGEGGGRRLNGIRAQAWLSFAGRGESAAAKRRDQRRLRAGRVHQPRAKPIATAAALYDQAEDIFTRHMATQNRLRYLIGVVSGILFLTV